MTTEEDRAVAERLFGTVQPAPASGGFVPDADALRQARQKDSECVMPNFCTGCGGILCLTAIGVSEFAAKLDVPVPQPTEEYFFQMDRCPRCGPGANDVRFRSLSELTS